MEIAVKSFLLALVIALAALDGSSAQAAERDVTVINGTGYRIKFLGFNPPGDDDWSENELEDTLRDGEKVEVSFDTDEEGCKWDIKVEWFDPGYPGVLWKSIDVCNLKEMTLHYDRATDKTSISGR